MADELTSSIAAIVDLAATRATAQKYAERLTDARRRLDGPLRVAIAGKVKAGKSTLLNAFLGEELAPTDAGECTKIVTWYDRNDQPLVLLHPRSGPPESRAYKRSNGALDVDLAPYTSAEVDHLAIGWPTGRLQDLTVLDTPGLASISTDVSARTRDALAPQDGKVPVADAVLYLLRHTHASDIHFLEAFHGEELVQGTPMNAVGVLSRADEIGACRLDALDVAARVAERYESDVRLRRLCPLVVPVAGLLGFAGATLRESEFSIIKKVAAAPEAETAELLLTADRFAARPTSIAVTELERAHLLSRLGLFGVRLCVDEIRSGMAPDATTLSAVLAERSGLTRLRTVLIRQFADRSRILKARSALAAVTAVLDVDGCKDGADLRRRVEEISSSAHVFEEVRILDQLHSGSLELRQEQAAQLDRLLGGSGHDPATRLGLADGAALDDVRQAALATLESWQALAEHPLSSRSTELAARGAVRTLEGLIADTSARS